MKMEKSIKFNNNKLQYLLELNGVKRDFIFDIFHQAKAMFDEYDKLKYSDVLKNKFIANLFFEPSTRTRNTFEISAKRLGANVINVDIANSATLKGESLVDTIANIKAMQVDIFIIRNNLNGMPYYITQNIDDISIINAGDGTNAHPTQGLLDLFTIWQTKGSFEELSVAIIGDILHSRVAHSDIIGLQTVGVKDIRLISPQHLQNSIYNNKYVKSYTNLNEGLKDVDVIIVLRLQKERFIKYGITNDEEYYKDFGITETNIKLAKDDAIIMHPGPINHRVEIATKLLSSSNSVILKQVTNGIAIRMAVLSKMV